MKCTLVGFLLSLAGIAVADSVVTFQVDMTAAVANATFNPVTQTMAARGSFNNWAAFPLTNNPLGLNPNLWTGTTNVAGNGTVVQYKYTIEPGASYEPVFSGGTHNRLITLPSQNGASISTPKVFYGDAPVTQATVVVKFQVNLAQQINTGSFDTNSSLSYVRGIHNGWSADVALTNDPSIRTTNQFGLVSSNVYVGSYEITGSPGQTMDYKFFIDTGANWESPAPGTGDPSDSNNRFFNLSDTSSNQALPIVFFSDAPFAPVATNDITFQVDMTAQVLNGNFDPTIGTVEVRGGFNSWGGTPTLLTNNPSGPNTNLYSTVVRRIDGVGAVAKYKFWGSSISVNSGWEQPNPNVSVTDGPPDNNRVHIQPSATSQTLPSVYFSDINPNDLVPVDTLVTFTVNMTNAVGTDAHIFDPLVDTVHINGAPNGFTTWDTSLPQLTNNPVGSRLYSIELLIPKGSPIQQTYKYGINGVDNEASTGQNHIRSIRRTGTYSMPLDTFGNQYVEPAWGQLTVRPASGGTVPVSWLGRPGVRLQSRTSLTGGSWQDVPNTDGSTWANGVNSPNGFVSVTNYPTTAGSTFLRLIK